MGADKKRSPMGSSLSVVCVDQAFRLTMLERGHSITINTHAPSAPVSLLQSEKNVLIYFFQV